MQFKTKIVKISDVCPVEGDLLVPGTLIKAVEKGLLVGEAMRVVQVSGHDILVNYSEKEAK